MDKQTTSIKVPAMSELRQAIDDLFAEASRACSQMDERKLIKAVNKMAKVRKLKDLICQVSFLSEQFLDDPSEDGPKI